MSKKVNGSRKGSKFERDISKKISLWFSDGKRDDLLWRTAGSGARQTVRRKKGLKTEGGAGDLSSTSDETKILTDVICFELKNYADINPFQLLVGENKLVLGWWNNLKTTAEFEGKIPVLIIKQDYKTPIWITDETLKFHLGRAKVSPTCIIYQDYEELIVYPLESIMKLKSEEIKDILNAINN